MGVFKRICLLVFGLAGLLSLVALALPWWGPWTEEARALLGVYWYYVTLECLIYVTTFGLLICLVREPCSRAIARLSSSPRSGAAQSRLRAMRSPRRWFT